MIQRPQDQIITCQSLLVWSLFNLMWWCQRTQTLALWFGERGCFFLSSWSIRYQGQGEAEPQHFFFFFKKKPLLAILCLIFNIFFSLQIDFQLGDKSINSSTTTKTIVFFFLLLEIFQSMEPSNQKKKKLKKKTVDMISPFWSFITLRGRFSLFVFVILSLGWSERVIWKWCLIQRRSRGSSLVVILSLERQRKRREWYTHIFEKNKQATFQKAYLTASWYHSISKILLLQKAFLTYSDTAPISKILLLLQIPMNDLWHHTPTNYRRSP